MLLLLLVLKRLLDLGTSHFSSSLLLGLAFQSGSLLIQKSLVFLFPLKEFQSLLLLVILQRTKIFAGEVKGYFANLHVLLHIKLYELCSPEITMDYESNKHNSVQDTKKKTYIVAFVGHLDNIRASFY